ncbi:hypothetical protein [Sebaldella sp. S0638]|uniref:hypothetical protein n=1 Tax=Sebaldella sp. S0638 TaxID=2957809 RepID=UPI0020A0E3CD|nr:hypothetical protein [Sebaldella sp. S0638]MCP1224539.1 hypothetical protein [Sebaldella sp. S0638]
MKKVILAMAILLISISSVGFGSYRHDRHNRRNDRRYTYRKVCVRKDRRGRCIRYENRRVPYNNYRHLDTRPPRFR